MNTCYSTRQRQSHNLGGIEGGFTLLELMLVVGILSTLALGTISLMDERDEEFRFDQTKMRLKHIRQAVIGDPQTHHADPPAVSGFVSDIGRLPNSLSELLQQGDLPSWGVDPGSGVGSGWRGPYLHGTAEVGGAPIYNDGWGNTGNAGNFGWRFEPEFSTGQLVTQSFGADGLVGGATVFEQDYPASGILVHAGESLVDIASWKVTLVLRNQGQSGSVVPDDTDGSTGGDASGLGEGEETVTICHKPTTSARQTLVIPVAALPAHLEHGDYLGACTEEVGEEGSTEGSAEGSPLPSENMTVRLRLYYPESGSMNWPDQWPQTDAERDAAPYLSEDVVIPAGAVPVGEQYAVSVSFGIGPKRVPFGLRTVGVVHDTDGSPVGTSGPQSQEVLLRPRFSTPTITLNWNLD